MTEIAANYDSRNAIREDKKEDKRKTEVETRVGAEIRQASMSNMVPRTALSDLTKLNGATSREKSGQRQALL
jgi:hypothetical protein